VVGGSRGVRPTRGKSAPLHRQRRPRAAEILGAKLGGPRGRAEDARRGYSREGERWVADPPLPVSRPLRARPPGQLGNAPSNLSVTVNLPDHDVRLVILGYPTWWRRAWTQGRRSKGASEMAQKGCEQTLRCCLSDGACAPIPDLPALTPERGGSTQSRSSHWWGRFRGTLHRPEPGRRGANGWVCGSYFSCTVCQES
jgi:hypothetical protein